MLGFFLTILIVLGLLGALYWRWRRGIEEEIAEGAGIEWEHFQKHEPEFLKGMSESQFRDIYKRVHEPRFPGYALSALATFLLTLPVTLIALAGLQRLGQKLGVLPQPVEMVRYVNLGEVRLTQAWECGAECQLYVAEAFAGFYYFFGVLITWLLIVAFYMRRFHHRRPGYLRDEIIRSRD
ncbi:hypothetical protein [Hyphococcus sp.]|uniref:hypothetical protein n=1 Tax=Hyphococcus sp. TaxID=2038636 RepID=UPI003CCBBE4D